MSHADDIQSDTVCVTRRSQHDHELQSACVSTAAVQHATQQSKQLRLNLVCGLHVPGWCTSRLKLPLLACVQSPLTSRCTAAMSPPASIPPDAPPCLPAAGARRRRRHDACFGSIAANSWSVSNVLQTHLGHGVSRLCWARHPLSAGMHSDAMRVSSSWLYGDGGRYRAIAR